MHLARNFFFFLISEQHCLIMIINCCSETCNKINMEKILIIDIVLSNYLIILLFIFIFDSTLFPFYVIISEVTPRTLLIFLILSKWYFILWASTGNGYEAYFFYVWKDDNLQEYILLHLRLQILSELIFFLLTFFAYISTIVLAGPLHRFYWISNWAL